MILLTTTGTLLGLAIWYSSWRVERLMMWSLLSRHSTTRTWAAAMLGLLVLSCLVLSCFVFFLSFFFQRTRHYEERSTTW